MASIRKISRAYRGQLARKYDAVREKQRRWHDENRIVEQMLTHARGTVLDVPVGTGRFLAAYKRLGLHCVGIDSSEEMIALAEQKRKKLGKELSCLMIGDALKLPRASAHTAVCVRFLNLVEEKAMRLVMAQLFAAAKSQIILTIRLGSGYYSNSQMCTHDQRSFHVLVQSSGWRVAEDEHECFRKGWHLMRLVRAR